MNNPDHESFGAVGYIMGSALFSLVVLALILIFI